MNKINSYIKLLLATFLLLPSLALAVEGQTLGLLLGLPQVNSSVDTTLLCGYDGSTTLRVQSSASSIDFLNGYEPDIFADAGGTMFNGLLDIMVPINNSGNLGAGGTLTVTGYYLDSTGVIPAGIRGPTLLTADIIDFGILDGGANDTAEFEISVTGGAVTTDPDWTAPTVGGVLVDLVNSGYAGSASATGFDTAWNCDGAKSTVGFPEDTGADPFECYGINKVTLWDKSGTTNDEIKIEKGGFRFPPGETFDPATDDVTITIDDLAVFIAAGSFEQNGSNLDYTYKTATGVKPKITVRLNVEKRQWELKLTDGDVSQVDNSDGLDITMSIGNFESTENVFLTPQGNKLKYSANPSVSCNTNDDGMKLSCIASMTVEHDPSGVLVTKSTTEGNLLHRDTVFDEPMSGDIGIFHTSCSECLECGDMSGNFTIVEISSLPGDNLSEVCGVTDASCSTLP